MDHQTAPEPRALRRVAMVSVHTSPLSQPGTGDAGGMNVYIAEVAKELARQNREVEIFTRATTGALPPTVELVPGVTVRHITAGPYEGLAKNDLPGQLCAFAAGVMRAGAARPEGWYDLVHSHYWLSGQVGWLAAERWNVPLVHAMHTMAKVKTSHLALHDRPEPLIRVVGEEQIVAAADDDSVAVVVVADLLGVPGFVKGAAQESLLKCHTECNAAVSKALGNHQKPQQRVLTWLDWEGSFARELDVVGECNDVYLVTVLDPSGQVTLRVKQKVNGMTENQLQRMTLASARKALKRD